ncbi:HHE domain-containing protein [Crepidotus variabilis]|uniref:HHE domain-containing protein n=1 Tax=Crepidotus variabilis TaxID=179855 RepID=A0A9P6E6Y7_9AGAR|nr:HHE domain-containing protein [Crepidotus variabilis]
MASTADMGTNTETGTLLRSITNDHREIFDCYDQYVKSQGDHDAQQRWSNQLAWEVARHSVGEELVVYPLLEKHLGADGKKMADEDRAEHQEVKKLLAKLEGTSAGSAEHAAILKSVIDNLKPHIEGEEKHDFPLLERVLSSAESKEAAVKFYKTKQFAPTRAHPSAPNKPPFETLAGFMAAPLDKLKDAFSKFPTEEQREVAGKN